MSSENFNKIKEELLLSAREPSAREPSVSYLIYLFLSYISSKSKVVPSWKQICIFLIFDYFHIYTDHRRFHVYFQLIRSSDGKSKKRDKVEKSNKKEVKKMNKVRRKISKEHRYKRSKGRDNVSEGPISEGSDDSSSEYSEEIEVHDTPENLSYERKVTIGLLSRAGYREHYWHNKIVAYFVILSYLITYDGISLFFRYSHSHGIYFTLNYGICMLLIGFPMCYLEMALGQYTSTGIFLVFDRMAPAFVGVAISALIINFLSTCVNHNVVVDMIAVATESGYIVSTQMPWAHCLNDADIKGCYAWPQNCNDLPHSNVLPKYPSIALSTAKQYKLELIGDTCVLPSTLSISNGLQAKFSSNSFTAFMTSPLMNFIFSEIEDITTWKKRNYPSYNYLFLSAAIAFFTIYILTRTRKTLVNVLSGTLVVTFCMISFLLHGTLTIFQPKDPFAFPLGIGASKALFSWLAWSSAVNLTLRTLKIGQGAWTFFGSLFGFHNNVILDCLLLTVVMIFLQFFYALFHIIIIDSYILDRAGRNYTAATIIFNDHNADFYTDPFAVVASLLDSLYIFGDYQTAITFWYSLVLAITTISNKIIRTEITISAITEMNVVLAEKSSRAVVVITVVLVSLLCQMFTLTENGYYRSTSIKRAVISISSVIVIIFELFVIGMFYGFRVVFTNTSLMVFDVAKSESKKGKLIVNSIMLLLWSIVIPLVVSLSFLYMIVNIAWNSSSSPLDIYNVIIIFVILLPIPTLLLLRMFEQYKTGRSFNPLFKRNPDLWGPRLRSNRSEAERAERMIRR